MKKIIKFGAVWCAGCTSLDSLAIDGLKFAESIDVDSNPEYLKKYDIKKLPTVIILENDIEVERIIGKTDIVTYFS